MHFSNSAFYLIYKFPRKEQKHYVLKHILILFKHKTCIVMFFQNICFKRFRICGYFVGGRHRYNIVTSSIYDLISRPVTSFSPMAACILNTSGAGWATCILIIGLGIRVGVRRNRCATSIRQHPPDTPHLRGKRNDSSDSDCRTKKNHSELLNEQPVRRVNTSSSVLSL